MKKLRFPKFLFISIALLTSLFIQAQNVGIGTTAPSAGLEIVTDGNSLNALRVATNQTYNTSPDVGIGFRFKYNTAGTYTSGAVISALKENNTDGNQSGSLRFWTNSAGTIAEKMRISSSGDVGIGTASPEYKLDVSGSFRSSGSATANSFIPVSSGIPTNGFYLPATNTLGWSTNSTNRMNLDANGMLGLGTSSPTAALHIANGNTWTTDEPGNTDVPSIYIYNTNNSSTAAHSLLAIRTNGNNSGNPFMSFDINGIKGFSIGMDNADAEKLKFHSNWNFNNSSTPAMTITTGNYVGIGTSSPEVPLHVATSVNQTISYGWFASSGGSGISTNSSASISIQADARIRASEFNAVSDARIKTGITNLNTESSLADINKLNVVSYSYVDKLINGSKSKTGFIAQQVESVNSQFVNQSADFIPSVFAMAKAAKNEQGILQVTTDKPHGLEKGDVVKFFSEGKKELIMTIEDVKSPTDFTVKAWTESNRDLFIYGKKVSDFRAIDFDQITSLSVGAIQELSKQVDKLKAENADLKRNAVQRIEFENLKSELILLRDAIKQKKN